MRTNDFEMRTDELKIWAGGLKIKADDHKMREYILEMRQIRR